MRLNIWRALSPFLGSISQTLTYPFDVLRRKMQVSGMQGGAIKYNGAIDALRGVLKAEGVSGLYRGLWPNLRRLLYLVGLDHKADLFIYCSESCPEYCYVFFHIRVGQGVFSSTLIVVKSANSELCIDDCCSNVFLERPSCCWWPVSWWPVLVPPWS